MSTLVLTLVGPDRAGLVSAVADLVAAHDGNWERSQLAELAGAFAGVVQVSVPDARADELRSALDGLEGLLSITAHGSSLEVPPHPPGRDLVITVLGNDRPGIVRDISAVLHRHDLSIEELSTETRDAAMYGGRLFEARMTARAPDPAAASAVRGDLERLATEIQVDITAV